ncbi:hypothetical protein FDECE_5209 [Fusarium decemcellulare]|nr:hypothetical protein FDECE_5209 [Fusarium decemcellulare]
MAFGSFLRSLLSAFSTSSRRSSHSVHQARRSRENTPPRQHEQQRPQLPRPQQQKRPHQHQQNPPPKTKTPQPQPTRAPAPSATRNIRDGSAHKRSSIASTRDRSRPPVVQQRPRAPTPRPNQAFPRPRGRRESRSSSRSRPPQSTHQRLDEHHHGRSRSLSLTPSTSSHPHHRRAITELHCSPTPVSNIGVISATDRAMGRETVTELIDLIAAHFSHIPYAVSGLAAMSFYGYHIKPFKVSIICPAHTREAQNCWARVQGMIAVPGKQDIWGVATSDGLFRQVRVRFPHDFDSAHTVRVGASEATILSLAGLADEIARTYVNELKHADLRRQEALGKEMMWVLERIVDMQQEEHMLTPERAPHLASDTFWVPFTLSYPDSLPLFEAAGWIIPHEEWHL